MAKILHNIDNLNIGGIQELGFRLYKYSKHEHAWLSGDGSMEDEMERAGMKCYHAWPDEKYDVLVGHGVGGWSYDGTFTNAKARGMKTVEVMHSVHASLTNPSICDAFVGLNQMATDINRHMPNARRIYGVIDWENYTTQSNGTKIGRLSRLAWEKNPQQFLDLARMFPSEQFVIAGGGVLEDEIRRYAPPNLEVLGMIRKMHKFYYELKYFAFSSIDECCCMSVAMAQAAGIPVICNPLPSLVETTGGRALYANSLEEFAREITFLLNHPSDAKEIGMAGRQWVKTNFNSVNLWDNLLDELTR